jgi:hypothetical protein
LEIKERKKLKKFKTVKKQQKHRCFLDYLPYFPWDFFWVFVGSLGELTRVRLGNWLLMERINAVYY